MTHITAFALGALLGMAALAVVSCVYAYRRERSDRTW